MKVDLVFFVLLDKVGCLSLVSVSCIIVGCMPIIMVERVLSGISQLYSVSD